MRDRQPENPGLQEGIKAARPAARRVIRLALMLLLMMPLALGALVATTHAQPASTDAPPASSAADVTSDAAPEAAPIEADEGQRVIGWVSIDKPLRQTPSPLAWVSDEDAGLSLAAVVKVVDRVATDPSLHGVVINLNEASLTLTQVDALAQAVGRVRQAGKKVLTFAESYDTTSYLLAAAGDEILLQHKGRVALHGLAVEEMYFAGLLEKIGVKADFVQVGRFKGADEALTRTGPSDAWNENFDALLDDLYQQVSSRLEQGRNWTPEQVRAVFTDAWGLSDQQLVARKVVDRLCGRDLSEATSVLWGESFSWVDLTASPQRARPQNPLAMMSLLFQEKATRPRRQSLAVIWAQGPITSGESGVSIDRIDPQASLLGGSSIGSRTLVQAIEHARDTPLIRGVVFYIDSPGGSALASDLIWQALRDLNEHKPVYVVIGPMAASGGYYIASAGREIYARPGSIIGSIGVVGGKLVLGDLYDKLGIRVHRRWRGSEMADMFNSVSPFTEPQRRVLIQAFEQTYDQFIDRVKVGRGDRIGDIDKVAQGRLFTGQQAVANGMADRLGGVEQALDDLAKSLSMRPGQYDTVNLPPPVSLGEFLSRTFGGVSSPVSSLQLDTAALATVRRLVGTAAWQAVSPVLQGMLLLEHEPVLTLLPTAIVIR